MTALFGMLPLTYSGFSIKKRIFTEHSIAFPIKRLSPSRDLLYAEIIVEIGVRLKTVS